MRLIPECCQCYRDANGVILIDELYKGVTQGEFFLVMGGVVTGT